MKRFFVINPQSANGQTGRRWPEIGAQVGLALGEFSHAFTERPLDAVRLTRRAIEEGYDCIVAVGGDGTINEVVNGFFVDGACLNPKASLAVIPRGTGGDFRKTLGWDNTVAGAVERLKSDRSLPMDVGLLEYTAPDGSLQKRYFANVCSFGISGRVVKRVNEGSKRWGGKLSFVLGTVTTLVSHRDREAWISVDGGPEEKLSITAVAVANGQYFGGGMKVAPGAQLNDGAFDVTFWSGYGLWDFAFKSKGVYSGQHVKWPGTRTLRCQRLLARSEHELLIDCDGEQPGRLPCSMALLPGVLQLKG